MVAIAICSVTAIISLTQTVTIIMCIKISGRELCSQGNNTHAIKNVNDYYEYLQWNL